MDYRRINDLLFTADINNKNLAYDCLIILGSRNCDYRVQVGSAVKADCYICSGGNSTEYLDSNGNEIIEADYIKNCLIEAGINESRIIVERESYNTFQNIYNCKHFLTQNMKNGIVTAGFHAERVRRLLIQTGYTAKIIPAYGPNTSPENWYLNDAGISIIFDELQKVYPEYAKKLRDE